MQTAQGGANSQLARMLNEHGESYMLSGAPEAMFESASRAICNRGVTCRFVSHSKQPLSLGTITGNRKGTRELHRMPFRLTAIRESARTTPGSNSDLLELTDGQHLARSDVRAGASAQVTRYRDVYRVRNPVLFQLVSTIAPGSHRSEDFTRTRHLDS